MSLSTLPVITDASFDAEVLESDTPVVVDFTAAWCPPCRMMAPVLDELSADRNDVRFVQVDVDTNAATAARFSVLSMPTFVVFRHGAEVARFVGARPKRRFASELAEVL